MRFFAFAFVSFEEPGDEQFVGQRIEFHSAGLTMLDDLRVVIEVDHFDDGSWLRCIVGDLVVVGGVERFAAGESHQGIAVGWRDVDIRPEQFFSCEAVPLRSELGAATEDSGDPGFRDAGSLVDQSECECFEQLGCREGALDVVTGLENGHGLIDHVFGIQFGFFGLALLEQFDDPAGVEVDAEADATSVLCEMFDSKPETPRPRRSEHQPVRARRKVLVGKRFTEQFVVDPKVIHDDSRLGRAGGPTGLEDIGRLTGQPLGDPAIDGSASQRIVFEERELVQICEAVDVGQWVEIQAAGLVEPEG